MASFCCSPDFPSLPKQDRFVGCDGKILSDELLYAQLEGSLEREDYSDAAKIRDELQRRGLSLNPPAWENK